MIHTAKRVNRVNKREFVKQMTTAYYVYMSKLLADRHVNFELLSSPCGDHRAEEVHIHVGSQTHMH